jgi:manganese/zinc/iron transport system substrate-binding protein
VNQDTTRTPRLSRRRALALAAVLLLVPMLASVPVSAQDAPALTVTTTTGMVADLVQNIGGERTAVTAMMGPGVDPHLYKPSAGDIPCWKTPTSSSTTVSSWKDG